MINENLSPNESERLEYFDRKIAEHDKRVRSENRFACLATGVAALTFGFILSTPLLIGLSFHYDAKRERELNYFLNSPSVQYNIGDDYHHYRNFGGPM